MPTTHTGESHVTRHTTGLAQHTTYSVKLCTILYTKDFMTHDLFLTVPTQPSCGGRTRPAGTVGRFDGFVIHC